MNPHERPLRGWSVGLSISESEDSTRRGFPSWQVNRTTLQVVSALFGQGTGVVFGHDWREDGVMEVVQGFAREMQPPDPFSLDESQRNGQPLLRNLLPWPDQPILPPEDQDRLASTLLITCAGLPPELAEWDTAGRKLPAADPRYLYLRARGLTHLRHQLNDSSDARLCLGGRRSGAQGRYPGIVEEAYLAIRSGRPIYLAGLLGGATSQVIQAVEGGVMPEDFCRPGPVLPHYDNPPVQERDPGTAADREIRPMEVWSSFANAGVGRLAELGGLEGSEMRELFHTPALRRAIELTLTGLSRLKHRQSPRE